MGIGRFREVGRSPEVQFSAPGIIGWNVPAAPEAFEFAAILLGFRFAPGMLAMDFQGNQYGGRLRSLTFTIRID
jgi:hypothetical protein